jgi:hypothetical protein
MQSFGKQPDNKHTTRQQMQGISGDTTLFWHDRLLGATQTVRVLVTCSWVIDLSLGQQSRNRD